MVQELHAVPNVAATVVVHPTPGVGDATTIADGIALLPAAGGTVFVREGTYAITSTITLPNKPVEIVGTGGATIVSLGAAVISAFSVPNTMTAYRMHVIENLRVTGTSVVGQTFIDKGDANAFSEVFCRLIDTNGLRRIVNFSMGSALDDSRVHFSKCVFVSPPSGTPNVLVNDPTVGTNAKASVVFFDECLTFETVIANGWRFSTDSRIIAHDSTFVLQAASNISNQVSLYNCQFITISGTISWTVNQSLAMFLDRSSIIGVNHNGTLNWTFNSLAYISGSRFLGTTVFLFKATVSNSFFSGSTTLSASDIVISGCEFEAVLTDTLVIGVGGAVIDGCSISNHLATTGSCIRIVGTATNNTISNCELFRSSASLAGGIEIAGSTGNLISGCNFVSGFTANSGGPAATPCIVETLAANNNRITGIHFDSYVFSAATPPFTIVGLGTVVEGVRQFSATALPTTDVFTIQVEHRAAKGITGVGTVKNIGVVNSLDVLETGIDFFGVTDTVTNTVAPGARFTLNPQINIGMASPPYNRYRVEIKSTVAGSPTTFSIRHGDQGVE